MGGATKLLGKYRSEVEIAVQHHLAMSLPGARYALQAGRERVDIYHCDPPPRKKKGGRGAVPVPVPVAGGPGACANVGVAAPEARAAGFRAVLANLKRRAFRIESPHVEWAAAT